MEKNCPVEAHYHALPPAAEWRAGAVAALRQRQQRASPARELVVDYISALDRPFTAEELVAELVDGQRRSGRATVYRTLDWLRTTGWVARVQAEGDQYAYTRLIPGHHHSIVCTNCGITLLFGGCTIDDLLSSTLASSGFMIEGHVLEIYGTCARCQGIPQP